MKTWMLEAVLAFVIAIGLFASGWHMGSKHVQTQWNASKEAMQAAVVAVQSKQAEVTTQVVTKYVDRVQTVTKQGATITKTIPVYIHEKDDDACPVPAGFSILLDSAATGSKLPANSGSTGNPGSPASATSSR